MDTVTHGLTGWLIARAVPSKEDRKWATAAVVVGSVLPDADHIASLFGSEAYLRMHRGISHSFAGTAVTSLVVALLLARFGKCKDLKKLYFLALLGQLSHIALDLLNSYGTQVLQPFSNVRVSFDLIFIIDLVFTGIVVAGLLLSRVRPARARAALVLLVSYVGLAAVLHARAAEAVRDAAMRHGVPVVSSYALPGLRTVPVPREFGIVGKAEAAAGIVPAGTKGVGQGSGLRGGIPLPAGPFSWNGFVDDGRTYLRAEVDPFDGEIAWKERARKGSVAPEAKVLGTLPDVRTYLWFARFPTVFVTTREGKTVVTFTDMRFGGGTTARPFVLEVTEAPGLPPRTNWGS